ncbi:unnamed protein product [Dibothriocephalus latus]|uniref:Uncharacterized protein n=1 Tax=Dibothriocephalus latus TaxID=60516 RepID=A0A3P7QMU8_DIBLA|nr:unnamed protein product [Dibothriocephalus latus]
MISESEIHPRTAARPLSSISIIVDRLKSARLQDTFDVLNKPESEPEILKVSRRAKAVNFTSDTSEAYWPDMVGCPVSTCVAGFKGQPEEPLQRSPNFGTNTSPTISESELDDDSNFWVSTLYCLSCLPLSARFQSVSLCGISSKRRSRLFTAYVSRITLSLYVSS